MSDTLKVTDLPFIKLDDLVYIFDYKNKAAAYMAIKRGTFPVPTYKLVNQIVADKEVVRQFFLQQREEGLASLMRCPKCGTRMRTRT